MLPQTFCLSSLIAGHLRLFSFFPVNFFSLQCVHNSPLTSISQATLDFSFRCLALKIRKTFQAAEAKYVCTRPPGRRIQKISGFIEFDRCCIVTTVRTFQESVEQGVRPEGNRSEDWPKSLNQANDSSGSRKSTLKLTCSSVRAVVNWESGCAAPGR